MRTLIARVRQLRQQAADRGMTTAEYAVGTLAAVAFAGVLFKVLNGAAVAGALGGVIMKALR